jgi:hypothetical protein
MRARRRVLATNEKSFGNFVSAFFVVSCRRAVHGIRRAQQIQGRSEPTTTADMRCARKLRSEERLSTSR